ncbi:MAG: TadE/TadG family type IV pilus assembly protein, partial [Pseudomonadota bacterium]
MPKILEFFCSLLKSRRGSSSVEFVIIAPVLLAALVSGVVVFDAVRAKRQTGLAVQTASDLITRLDFINDGRRDNIFAAARTIIGKYDNGSNLVMTMSSIAKPVDPDSE